MDRNRIAIAACLVLLCAVPRSARGDSSTQHPMSSAPNAAQSGSQRVGSLEDDFAGLDLSDEQKSEIEKIRQDTESRRGVVAKDSNLNSDQKNAMIQGYARLEYSQIFRVLTPIQQRVVRQRIMARRAADQASKGPQPHQAPKN
jgi:Spy/CpxP family protein refolding chaperone